MSGPQPLPRGLWHSDRELPTLLSSQVNLWMTVVVATVSP